MLVRFLLILFLFNNFYYSITIIRFLFNLVEGIKAETPYKIILRGWSSNALDIAVSAKVHLTNNPIMDITGFRFQIIQKDVFTANSGSWYGSEFKEFAVAETYLITPLTAGTTFLIRVASRNVEGISDWSEVQEFATLP